MAPIEKNVNVVDESGNGYESTWPKRANGLVKKGRARWLDGQTICLTCPPIDTEDMRMEDSEMKPFEQTGAESGLTLDGLLARMDMIRQEMYSLSDAIKTVDCLPEDCEAGARATAIGCMFEEREKTCQQQFLFLERIYNDHFSAASESEKTARIKMTLEKMNESIAACAGNQEAVKNITAFYGELMKQSSF